MHTKGTYPTTTLLHPPWCHPTHTFIHYTLSLLSYNYHDIIILLTIPTLLTSLRLHSLSYTVLHYYYLPILYMISFHAHIQPFSYPHTFHFYDQYCITPPTTTTLVLRTHTTTTSLLSTTTQPTRSYTYYTTTIHAPSPTTYFITTYLRYTTPSTTTGGHGSYQPYYYLLQPYHHPSTILIQHYLIHTILLGRWILLFTHTY